MPEWGAAAHRVPTITPSCHSPSLLVGKSGLGSPSCLRDVDSQAPSHSFASLLPVPLRFSVLKSKSSHHIVLISAF